MRNYTAKRHVGTTGRDIICAHVQKTAHCVRIRMRTVAPGDSPARLAEGNSSSAYCGDPQKTMTSPWPA
jgi:hypothetical protein